MYRATDFDWVVTVPAIWTAQGKHMMRVAAYKVGRASCRGCVCGRVVFDAECTCIPRTGRHTHLVSTICQWHTSHAQYIFMFVCMWVPSTHAICTVCLS